MLVGRDGGVVVVLAPAGAVAGVDVRGAPVGTRELDLLDPSTLVDRVDAVVLAAGGLAAVDGVVRWLERRGRGFPVGPREVVPIVPAAAASGLAASGDGAAACEAAVEGPPEALAMVGGTAVGLVVVGAALSKAQCRRVAMSAQDGFARAGVDVPATVFALATGVPADTPLDDLCTRAADALERAVRGS